MTNPHPLRCLLLLVLVGCARTSPAPVPAATATVPTTSPVLAVTAAARKSAVARDSCADLDDCVARLRILALRKDEFLSLDPADQALIARLITLDGVTPRLVVLLADPDQQVAELAAAALRDVPHVDPAYLPQVKAGLDRKLGWLPPVLGHMDSDAAVQEAIARYLGAKDSWDNQMKYPVSMSGRRAIPWIVKQARCTPACGEDDISRLADALKEMGHERAAAAAPLMDLAEAKSSSTAVAKGALELLAALDSDGRGIEARLPVLAGAHPELKDAVDSTLIGIHSELAGEIYARMLDQDSDATVLRDLSGLGRAGRSAGPKVMELLDAPNWELRIAAATTLGEIGYEPAASALIQAAHDPADVRLQWVAVRALARLRAIVARTTLEQLARDHWYPPVREAAAMALKELALPPPAPDPAYPNRNAIDRFWSWQDMGETAPKCEDPAVTLRATPGLLDGSTDAEQIQMQSLAYPMADRIPPPPPPPGSREPKGGQTPHLQMQVPTVALRLDHGWLLGRNAGEWGGELVYLDDAKHARVLFTENIEGLHRLGSRVIVLSGVAHLSLNNGAAYELVRHGDDWQLQPWRTLPAAPERNSMTAAGDLLVETTHGGTVLIAPDGTLRMAPCADVAPRPRQPRSR